MKLLEVFPVGNFLGEGILWQHQTQMLWWTDIQARRLYRYDWQTKSLRHYATPERVGSFGFVANSDRLIVAFESGIALYHPETQHIHWLGKPEAEKPHVRFNDGRVDRQGRFWAGTMVEGDHPDISAGLYCVDAHGCIHQRKQGIRISNSLCFSTDGHHAYFADSPRFRIRKYALTQPTGELSEETCFATLPDGVHPDGATVDCEDHVWNAQWGAGKVVRYNASGSPSTVIQLPVSQPTCITFGGPDLDLLFVTSASVGLSPAQLATEPEAGAVFVFKTPFRGLPEQHYRYNRNILPGN